MTALYVISTICFFVMLYVAVAVAQSIRSRRLAAADLSFSVPSTPKEFFETGEYREPNSLRLIQQIDQQVAQRSNIGISPLSPVPGWDADSGSDRGRTNRYGSLLAVSEATSASPRTITRPGDPGFTERRQSREGAPDGVERRADRLHYNKDMGDLSDPYTQHARPLGESGRRSDHSRITQAIAKLTPRDNRSG